MAKYVILIRFSPDAFHDPKEILTNLEELRPVLGEQCPDVKWTESLATLGSWDIVDVVESNDPWQVEKVTLLIRGYLHATTETLSATPWNDFLENLKK